MTTISQLSQVSALSGGDRLPVYAGGDTRSASLLQVAAYVQANLEGEPDETVYSITTNGSGFTLAVLPVTVGGSVHARISLSGPAATGTIILPGIDDRTQGQEVLVTCTQTVTALTISGNGASLSGAPTSVGPTAPFKLRFDRISTTWDKVSS